MSETLSETEAHGFASIEELMAWLPGQSAAAIQAIKSLYIGGQYDRAENLATMAIRLYEDNPEVWLQHAMVPMHRPDKALAALRFKRMRIRFPEFPAAFGFGAMALRQLDRAAEAEALLEGAMAAFPSEWRMFVEYAQCACSGEPGDEPIQRCEVVRSKFPGRPEGHWLLSNELMRVGRLPEAEAAIEIGISKLPNDPYVMWQWARVATARQDWPEAERRWTLAKQRHPNWPRMDSGLRGMRMAAYPKDWQAFVEHARTATASGPREEAIRRWEAVRNRFPEVPEGHWMLSNELARVGRLDEADVAVQQGIDRFPDDRYTLWQWARTATQRHDWAEAERRFEIAKSHHPDWVQLDEGISEMRMAAGLLRLEDTAAIDAPPAKTEDSGPGELMLRFESVGDNCEFGIVQRIAGVEPLGLLRWANINATKLLEALNNRFEGVGEAGNTRLWVNEYAEYNLTDNRYFGMHTFINAGQTTEAELLPKLLRRLRFLKDKLIEDLTDGEKIFVHKSTHAPVSVDEMRALGTAFRRYGNATLLCVMKPTTPEKDHTVERIADGVLAGYMSELTMPPQAARGYAAEWFALCGRALQLAGR